MTEEWQHGEQVIDQVQRNSNGDMHVYRVCYYAEKHITPQMQILFDVLLLRVPLQNGGFQPVNGYKDRDAFCIKKHASRRVEDTYRHRI